MQLLARSLYLWIRIDQEGDEVGVLLPRRLRVSKSVTGLVGRLISLINLLASDVNHRPG